MWNGPRELLSRAFLMLSLLVTALAVPWAGSQPIAQAQDEPFPQRSIEWIVTVGAGGPPDVVTRVIAEVMAEELGVDIMVRNVPGAAGRTAYAELLRSDPDGHTIMTFTPAQPITGNYFGEYENLTDPLEVEWIGTMYLSGAAVWVKAEGEIQSVQDLRDIGRSVRIAEIGRRGSGIPYTVALLHYLGVPPTLVAGYTGGPELVPALLREEADILGRSIGGFAPHLGDLAAIMQAGPERDPALPETPTAAEVADAFDTPEIADLTALMQVLFSVGAPPGTPRERVTVLEDALQRALARDDIAAWAAETEFPIVQGMGSAETGELLTRAFNALEALDLKVLLDD